MYCRALRLCWGAHTHHDGDGSHADPAKTRTRPPKETRTSWQAFLSGRDPNPPVEPRVVLTGCKPFGSDWATHMNPECNVCHGSIRGEDFGYHCEACDRSDPATEVILDAAQAHESEAPSGQADATPAGRSRETFAEGATNLRASRRESPIVSLNSAVPNCFCATQPSVSIRVADESRVLIAEHLDSSG